MGKMMPAKRLPWSVLKFGKHFRFYLGGKGTHQQKMRCILKHVCIKTQTYTELTQYNAWSTWKQCFRETTQSIICISIEGEKIRKKSGKHMLFIIFPLFSPQRFMDYGLYRKPLFHPYPSFVLTVNFILVTHFPKKLSALTFVDGCHNISQQKATACVVNSNKTRSCRYFFFLY